VVKRRKIDVQEALTGLSADPFARDMENAIKEQRSQKRRAKSSRRSLKREGIMPDPDKDYHDEDFVKEDQYVEGDSH
jgi:hypothetical protein